MKVKVCRFKNLPNYVKHVHKNDWYPVFIYVSHGHCGWSGRFTIGNILRLLRYDRKVR